MANSLLNGMIGRALGQQVAQHPLLRAGDYALIDGARRPSIYRTLQSSAAEYACLYDGVLPERLARAAPYIVDLRRSQRFAHWYYEQGWGDACGVLLRSSAGLTPLRRHFRTLAYAQTQNGRKLLFRYYDPRVIRTFLPTCAPAQLAKFFGPVKSFVVEPEAAEGCVVFEYDPKQGLQRQELESVDDLPRSAPSTPSSESL